MFKAKYRLPSNTNFEKTFLKTPFYVLKTKENGLDYNRFGFVVSKVVDKRAVARNRLKRVFRAAIEKNFDKIKKGKDFLFIINRAIAKFEAKNIYTLIEKDLKENNLI